jgi:hypothetical protein
MSAWSQVTLIRPRDDEIPGQPAAPRVQGTGGINVREAPDAGYKVVGDKPLKLLTVHVVDKGKPLAVHVPRMRRSGAQRVSRGGG